MYYYDPHSGEKRIKRRYVWFFWGLTSGAALGWILGAALF